MSGHDYLNNTAARLELLGVPNIFSSFSQFNSAPRVAMFNHHLPQTMIIDKPEFNKLFTGVEHNLIEYTFNSSRRDHDCEIIAIIPKYRAPLVHRDNVPQIYVITLTLEPNGERHLDYFEINRHFMGTNGFGFIPEIQNAHRVSVGEFLEKDTPITNSPAVKGNQYCMGTNLNVVYGSFPETIEDAFIISKSAAERLQTQHVEQIVINCRMDRRPLNINGNEYEDKFLPDIGSYVRSDGALCAFRPVHWTTCVADGDPEALREALPLQDDIIYIEPGSKIVDITFNINRSKLNNCYDQALLYQNNNTKCWEDIYTTYMKYKGKYKLTPKMSTLVTTSIYRMIAQGANVPQMENEFRKVMRNFDIEGANGNPVDFIQAVVTYTVPRPVSNGSKLTDQAGAKGVIGRIYPDDWMPVDGYGIRADIWIDMNSPVGRNNPGQLYETGINRISEFVRREVKRVYESKGSEAAFEVLMDWYHDVNENYEKRIREVCLTAKDRNGIVVDAIETSPKIWIPPFLEKLTPNDNEFWNALVNIQTWADKWNVKSTPIRYKSLQADGTGKEFITEEVFAIGSKYILQLHKIPEIFAPGPASVNHIGVPTKSTFEAKHYPVTVNPYRFGEDELRVMAMDTDIREVTRFQNLLSNSPIGVNTTIQSLLLSPHPTRIKRIPISNGELLGSSAVLNLFHNITATLGVQTKTTKDDDYSQRLEETLQSSVDLENSIWNSDVVDAKDAQIKMFDDEEGSMRRSNNKRSKVQKMIEAMPSDDIEDNLETEEEEE